MNREGGERENEAIFLLVSAFVLFVVICLDDGNAEILDNKLRMRES